MYHWLELHPSIPKTVLCKGNRITMIALEKHWGHAERSRLSSKWSSAKTKQTKKKPSVFLAECSREDGQLVKGQWVFCRHPTGIYYRWAPEIVFLILLIIPTSNCG